MAVRETDAVRMTLAEFEALPPSDEERLELDCGVLVREPFPGAPHGAAAAHLIGALHRWAEVHGGTVLSETGVILSRNPPTVRGPDLSWLAPDRAAYGLPEGFLTGAPELVVEVVSPSNTAADILKKTLQYLDAGARQVWVAYPRTRTLVVHTPDRSARALGEEDLLEAPDLLPGFSLRVSEIFRP